MQEIEDGRDAFLAKMQVMATMMRNGSWRVLIDTDRTEHTRTKKGGANT